MSYLDTADESYRKAKGVQRSVVEKQLTHLDYRHMYNSVSAIYERRNNGDDDDDDLAPPLVKRQRRFASISHQLYTIDQAKVALNCRDNKRMWISQNESVPFGHYSLT